jgi:hypothetical protein
MQTTQKTLTTVEITPQELKDWIASHIINLTSDGATVKNAQGNAKARLEISWGITKDYLDTFLKTVILNLPAKYNVQMIEGNDKVAARVSWQA